MRTLPARSLFIAACASALIALTGCPGGPKIPGSGGSKVDPNTCGNYAASDAVHAAQGALYEANAQVSRLEAEIRHVVDSRNRLQARRDQLQQQIGEWTAQREHCTEQIAQAEEDRRIALIVHLVGERRVLGVDGGHRIADGGLGLAGREGAAQRAGVR